MGEKALERARLQRVPKLAGKSNWTVWAPRFLQVLDDCNKNLALILTGKSRCPAKPEGEDIPADQRAKIQRKINLWKKNNFLARVKLGETLDDETGASVQAITDSHKAWEKLEELYAENEGEAADRCWDEFLNLSYEKSGVKAPEFVRQYQRALWQTKLAKISTNHRLNVSNFIRAVGKPKFSEYVNNLEFDRGDSDIIETLYACFIQFEADSADDKDPDLCIFGKDPSDSGSGPTGAPVKPAGNSTCSPNPESAKTKPKNPSKSPSVGSNESAKKRPNTTESGEKGTENTVKIPRKNPTARTQNQPRVSNYQSPPVSQESDTRTGSPLFVPQAGGIFNNSPVTNSDSPDIHPLFGDPRTLF